MPKAKLKARSVTAAARSQRRPVQVLRADPRAISAAKPAPAPKHVWLLAIGLSLISTVIYLPVLSHPFVNYDDQAYIIENEHIHSGITYATLRWALVSIDESNWHPLTWLSHALDCQLFGLNPAGHHATNLVLHTANAVLLFWLMFHATGARWRSLAVAALFALHPLNVESVAWAAERKNVLSMFLLLLTVAAYGWYARRPGVARYMAVVGLFAAGLAAKPMIVTLPFALLLLDYWPLQRMQRWTTPSGCFNVAQRSWQRLLAEKLPLIGLSVASCLITLHAQKMSMATTEALPLSQRMANASYSYVMYLWKALWPARLSAFYPYEGDHLSAWRVALCLVLPAAISFFVWSERRSRAYLLVGWLWFLGNLVPVIGLVQVGDQGMADRYAYLPLIGIFVMAVWGVTSLLVNMPDHLVNRRLRITAAVIATVVVLSALSILTIRQIATWRSSYDLWAHALQVTNDNYLAEDYMGTALLVQAYESKGQRYSDEAAAHFRNAARINPHDAISHLNLGADFHEHGKLQEAIEQYAEMLRYTRDEHLMAKAYLALGAAYGQLHQFDRARESLRMAVQLEPGNQGLFLRMGQLAMEERIAQLQVAASAHPTAQSYLALGELDLSAGHLVEARESLEQALKLNPKLDEARAGLASIMSQQSVSQQSVSQQSVSQQSVSQQRP